MVVQGVRVVRPTRSDEWVVVAGDQGVVEAWEKWAAQELNALAAAYDQLATNPLHRSLRQAPLAGGHATVTHDGRTFVRWQYEVTSGGRLFYFVEDPDTTQRKGKGPRLRRRVIIEAVHPGHPKRTERKRG